MHNLFHPRQLKKEQARISWPVILRWAQHLEDLAADFRRRVMAFATRARQYALIHRAIPKKDEPQQIGQGFLFPNCHCNFVLGDFVDLLIFMKFHLRRVWCIYETYVSTLEQRAHQGAVFKNLGRFEKKHHVTPQENGEILKSPCFLNVSSF